MRLNSSRLTPSGDPGNRAYSPLHKGIHAPLPQRLCQWLNIFHAQLCDAFHPVIPAQKLVFVFAKLVEGQQLETGLLGI